jgi:hypothetical protein
MLYMVRCVGNFWGGNHAIVGAVYDDTGATGAGSAYIYK